MFYFSNNVERKEKLETKKSQEITSHMFQVHQQNGNNLLDDKNDVLVIVTPIQQHPNPKHGQQNEAFIMEKNFDNDKAENEL